MTNKLLLIAMLVGCGTDSNGVDGDPWVGDWMTSGTQSTTCGGSSTTNQLSDMVVILDIDSGLQTLDNSCTLDWDVSGERATLRKGQVCTVNVNGFNVTVGWTDSSMHRAGEIVTGTTSGATNNGCSFTQQITMTRL